MAEQKRKSKLRAFFGVILKTLLVLLAMATAYVCAVVLQMPGADDAENYVVAAESEAVTRMQSGSMNDPKGLAQLFGAPLPSLPGYAVTGEGGNASHDGETVRVAVLRYEGLTITAVQPASAAPLLLRDELDVSLLGDIVVLSLPAMLAQKDDAYCVYFSNASAAYSIYAAHADKTAFFDMLDRLTWAQ